MSRYLSEVQVSEWLRIGDPDDDIALEAAIAAAEGAIDAWCGWAFDVPTAATARVFRVDDACRVDLGCGIANTTGLVVKTDENDDGTYETTWASTDYTLEPLNGIRHGLTGVPYSIIASTGDRWFPTGNYRPALEITAQWGWAATPDAVMLATRIQASRWHERRNSREGVVGFEMPAELDGDVRAMLALYRRPSAMIGIA